MTVPPSTTPRGSELREILSSITGYSNDITFGCEYGERTASALALLEIASHATAQLERVFQTARKVPAEFDDVTELFCEVAPGLAFWPVPFNEVMDFKPYKALGIGYARLDSKSPRKRTGATVFAYYARLLVQRIEFLRQECGIGEGASPSAEHDACNRWNQLVIPFIEKLSSASAPPPLLLIQKYRPAWLGELGQLPDFSKASAPLWTAVAKRFFGEAIPAPEQVDDLAKAINDADVTYDSEIRARIVERVGRAVKALAP